MANCALLDVATCICTKCVDPIFKSTVERGQNRLGQNLESFVHLKDNYDKLVQETKDLDVQAKTLQRNMKMEQTLNVCNEDVIKLDGDIRDLQAKISEVTVEYDAMFKCLCGCTPNFRKRYRLGKRITQYRADLEKYLTDAREKNAAKCAAADKTPEIAHTVLSHKPPEAEVEPQVLDNETVWTEGISDNLNNLKAFVREDKHKIIGVYGTGGVGKTTLLKEFNNDFLQETCGFQSVIYVTVSNDKGLNVRSIQRKIAKRLDLIWDESKDESFWATALQLCLEKRSFVTILDDVWKKFDLATIGIPRPGGNVRGKLIFASRSLEVCNLMGSVNSNIKVETLKDDEAWVLFRNKLTPEAASAIQFDQNCKNCATQIVEQCKGLPLALNVIGSAVARATSYDVWKAYNETIRNSVAGLADDSDEDNEVKKLLARLEISYTLLEASLKDCFLYCSLFPEDYSINQNQLVEYWAAEGFIGNNHRSSLEEARRQGIRYIQMLRDACLLEIGDTLSEVKIHDIIRDMAIWVACDRGKNKSFIVKAGHELDKDPIDKDWVEAKKISLMCNPILKFRSPPPRCNCLQTLLLQNNKKLTMLPKDFFKPMPLLKVLDLSDTRLKELPIEDGDLPELLYLNLRSTRISALPYGLGSVCKLKHLDLSRTSALVTVPDNVISRLSQLQILNMYCSKYGEWIAKDTEKEDKESDGTDSDDTESYVKGVHLEELNSLENLQALGITAQSFSVLQKLFKAEILRNTTRYLGIEYFPGVQVVHLSEFRHLKHLTELSLNSCRQLNQFKLEEMEDSDVRASSTDEITMETSDASDSEEISNTEDATLEVLALTNLPNLQKVSGERNLNIPYLKMLRELNIKSCPKLENISWVFQLHSLEKLMISECHGIKEVVEEELEEDMVGKNIPAFSRLEVITLSDLPMLKLICRPRSLPSLKIITVKKCPNLKRLPLGPSYEAKKLKKISGQDIWWKQLKWEAGSIASSSTSTSTSTPFHKIFVPI